MHDARRTDEITCAADFSDAPTRHSEESGARVLCRIRVAREAQHPRRIREVVRAGRRERARRVEQPARVSARQLAPAAAPDFAPTVTIDAAELLAKARAARGLEVTREAGAPTVEVESDPSLAGPRRAVPARVTESAIDDALAALAVSAAAGLDTVCLDAADRDVAGALSAAARHRKSGALEVVPIAEAIDDDVFRPCVPSVPKSDAQIAPTAELPVARLPTEALRPIAAAPTARRAPALHPAVIAAFERERARALKAQRRLIGLYGLGATTIGVLLSYIVSG